MSKVVGGLFGSTKQVTQPTGFQTLPGFAQSGLETAVNRARGFDPSLFAPAPLTPEQTQAAGALSGLADIFTDPSAFGERLATFQDPFEEQVVQSTLDDIQRATAGSLSDIGAGATAAGGFGGTRQAILESDLLGDQARAIAASTGALRSQGFQNAIQNALSSIGQQADISGNLFNLGGALQNQATATQQAPIEAARFLGQISGLVPTGGGQIGFRQEPGFFQRLGSAQQGLSSAGSALSSLGGFF